MKNHLKIVVLGDSSVGKTSLLAEKYYSENIEPNLGTNFMTKDITIEDEVLSIEVPMYYLHQMYLKYIKVTLLYFTKSKKITIYA